MADSSDWAEFRHYYIEPAVPSAVKLGGEPSISLFVAEHASRLGVRIFLNDPFTLRLKNLHAERVVSNGLAAIEISTSDRSVYKEFFYFGLAVAENLSSGKTIQQAVDEAIHNWGHLLSRSGGLSEEAEIGLYGELLILKSLQLKLGDRALDSWIGPRGEPHDFRFSTYELEVKTTQARERHHVINSWEQMLPSPKKSLFLVSVQLQPGGESGVSLPALVEEIGQQFSPPTKRVFADSLLSAGFDPTDTGIYTTRFERRAPIHIIPVDNNCPRITRELLHLPAGLIPRLGDIHYRIDVTGMGHPEDSRLFKEKI